MKIHKSLSTFKNVKKPIITIGTFDGVHFGHKKILQKVKNLANEVGGESVLFTFEPHPRMVLHPEDHGLQLLNSPDEKIELLQSLGLQHLVIQPFTENFSRYNAVEYVRDFLVNQMKVHTLIVGYDHHFGRNREGDFKLLEELSDIYQFSVKEITAKEIDDCKVSSTKIRNALWEGDVERANSYLGYSYTLTGMVVDGNKFGRKIGFPTANIHPSYPYKLIPGNGVYAVRISLNGKIKSGMMNIGTKPTVTDEGKRNIEVHIFDWKEDVYGKDLEIEFAERIRSEIKFEKTEDLQKQLEKDKEASVKILG